jgi:hypothetical protein
MPTPDNDHAPLPLHTYVGVWIGCFILFNVNWWFLESTGDDNLLPKMPSSFSRLMVSYAVITLLLNITLILLSYTAIPYYAAYPLQGRSRFIWLIYSLIVMFPTNILFLHFTIVSTE